MSDRTNYERRRRPRVPCAFSVLETTTGNVPCRATNISEDGIYVRRLEGGVLLEGEQITLELQLPGDIEPVWASGQVVEQVEEALYDAAAIEFTAIAACDRRRLRLYVARARQSQLRVALQGLSQRAAARRAA